ncbi:hypothetical protein CF8_3948 [Nocardioides sp. CF8]|uniref:endonuclease/exonuclease/phosphatase family protein n=1 Tax=Nocardioides sp. CF8 TaxID=110319 RepID=UPI00032F5216|nr:endonuclease/exonuclease/phosphatase family protein [Nocardioides sp. CF8]EON22181.1 hypothetical protein CF8_3948 [Nocardioides sp. CF8]
MKKGILLALPLVLICPLMLLVLGMGNASIEAARAACATTATPSAGGSFGIGTLNWRGASHYAKSPHPGERPYGERVPNMVAKIGSSAASIIGFQEFEPPQAEAFLKATGGAWEIVAGKRRGKSSTADAIAYQPGAWKVDEVRYVSIRYGGPIIQVPLVRFTSTGGLGSIWVLNTHHPADAVGGTDAMRDAAMRTESQALRQLQEAEPNTPLLLTGDMNDRARFKQLFLSSADGWSTANPSDEQIDWIMGSPAVTFSGTVVDQSTNDKAHHYTDHPFVHTTAQLTTPTPERTAATAELGVMPDNITATPGGPVHGEVVIANANIKLRSGATPGIRALASSTPDFITLNEVGDVPLPQMEAAGPGYGAYREPAVDNTEGGASQSLNNVIMWRSDTWTWQAGGRIKIVDNDQGYIHGKQFLWDRYATWAVFSRGDGAVVSVIATHHMTNVYKSPQQWGNPPMSRAEQYDLGMDYLIQLSDILRPYGPVFVGGDMNSHQGDGHAAAATRMAAAGFGHTKDSGVIYNFYAAPVAVAKTWEIASAAVHSDHPALFTRMAMNGAAPSAPSSSRPEGCPPCPTTVTNVSMLLPNATGPGSVSDAGVAAAAAHQAGFRGEDLVTAVAIARVESTWNPRARNGTHFGLWQIAKSHKGKVPGWNQPGDIYDPLLNAQYAFALYSARPGAAEAKFADWIPFEKTDYRQYLDVARQAAAATSGDDITNVADTGCTTSTITFATELSAELKARVDAMMKTPNGLCSLSWTSGAPCTYKNQCPKVVDAVYGGPGVGRGHGDGEDVAQGIIDAGLAQSHGTGLDPLPPVGAVVSYNTGNGVGHVAIYVGGGTIFGNDYGCSANGVYGCVGFADVHTPGGSVTWALPQEVFDLGGMPTAAA